MKNWILFLLVGLVFTGCMFAPMAGPNTSSPAYYSATPENQARISAGKIGIGMSMDECRAAWPDTYFQLVRASSSSRGRYELWRVEGAPRLYLHIYDGRIESVTEYPH